LARRTSNGRLGRAAFGVEADKRAELRDRGEPTGRSEELEQAREHAQALAVEAKNLINAELAAL
jgi:hypothetical protein